ncbi:unnamed protein product [Cuscuta epithymum]|uniref:TFIIS central domain-containing protein n=1 Tax=Cuscuta epithymum TaxID=186058 RepID=A0AAV0ENJ5_9ASTE|nr:unnamed protein product [Cuscuta epithymum]
MSSNLMSEMQMVGNMPNNTMHDFPGSSGPVNPAECVDSLVSVNQLGQTEYKTGVVQSSSSIISSVPQQSLSSDRVFRGVSTNVGVEQKLSVPSKRKADGEPQLHVSSPRQLSSSSTRRAGGPQRPNLQPKASPTSTQTLPPPNRKAMRNEPLSSKAGLQRQGPKGRAVQADTVAKNHTDSSKAVRSKMRESLAGALALVCQRKNESTSNEAKDESESKQGKQQPSEEVNTAGFPELAVEDIPFSDSFFVKDDLLQGNGLTWVMDLDMGEEVKETNELPLVQNDVSCPEDLASEIESELFKLFRGVNKKYKEKGRSLLFNLKDPNNPELRERVMSGEILPERLCSMTAEELASKELSEWRTAKAEELAQMVVLPDSDGDMRRLVKKTHKGEYQVVFQSDYEDVNIAAEISAGATTPITTQFQQNPKSSEKKQDLSHSLVIQTDEADLMQGMMVDEFKEADFLSPIVTLDEFMESLDSEPPFENLPVDATSGTPPSVESTLEGSSNNTSFEGKTGEVIRKKVGLVGKLVGPEADVKSISHLNAKKESPCGNASAVQSVWEGELQLSISISVAVMCYFRSGETTSTKEWTNSLEVKGRVRLDAFEKFLLQLPMSRSRAVMVVQFVLKDKSSEGGRKSLSEVVDSYVSDDRLGFAEPAPGVELYLCPPQGRVLDILTKHVSKEESSRLQESSDNGLVGVVVWRKHHHHHHQITSTISTEDHKQHVFQKQQPSIMSPTSRRPHEKEAVNVNNVNLLPEVSLKPTTSTTPLLPQGGDDDDDDDDIPPGFGPPKGSSRDDDDLPEFNFSGNIKNLSPLTRQPHPQPPTHAHLPLPDQMRQLVQKYGQTDNNRVVPGGFGIEPWNDDDDDIPEWQPGPQPPPNSQPPGPTQGIGVGFHQRPSLGHPRMQNPQHVTNLSPRWHPQAHSGTLRNQQQAGQYFGSPVVQPGQPPGGDYRRDSGSNRRF